VAKLNEILRQVASEKKISLEKLAIQAGITNATLHSILNKNDAKISQLESLASILGVSPVIFFSNESGTQTNYSQSATINTGKMEIKTNMNKEDCQKELEKAFLEIEYLKRENDLLRSLTQK